MKWVELCLRNKLLIYVTAGFICLIGAVCSGLIPIAPFPSVQLNSIDIHLSYPGANAQTVERQVTSKLVAGLQSIHNLQQVTATSQADQADIDLTLNNQTATSLLQTQMQITQAIASSDLPSVVPQPTVHVEQGQSDLVDLLLSSPTTSVFALQNFIQSTMTPSFRSLPGVLIYADDDHPIIRIALNPKAMAEYHLDPTTVSQLLDAAYQSNPLGALTIAGQSYVLNAPNSLATLSDLQNLVVGYQWAHPNSTQNPLPGEPITLQQIATVHFEPRALLPTSLHAVNGHPSAEIDLYTEARANPFQISKTVTHELQRLQAQLPPNTTITKVYDVVSVLKTALFEMLKTIAISTGLVILIGLLFLGRFKATLIPIVTIPICLAGALIALYSAGHALTVIALLAMVIAVGLVVDDAIVVIENITRYLEHGLSKRQAILQGTQDIALTIIGITLTLVAVYLPILCSSNVIVGLEKPFVFTLLAAVLLSGVVALTLTPVMAVHCLTEAPPNRYQQWFERQLSRTISAYHRLLKSVLRFSKTALIIIIVLLIGGGYAASQLPKSVFPNDPDLTINITELGSPSDTVQSLQQKLTLFAPFYHDPRLAFYYNKIDRDPNSGQLTGKLNLHLKPQYLTQTYTLLAQINHFIQTHHIANTYAQAYNFSSAFSNFDVSVYLYGSSLAVLNQQAAQLTSLMKQAPAFSFVTNQIAKPQKQLMFTLDSAKAASLGITPVAINQLLSTYYGGYTLNNDFTIDGLSVPIVVQLNKSGRQDPSSLASLMIQSPITQQYYPLDTFVSLRTIAQPLMINTLNGQVAVEVDANMTTGHSVSQGIALVNHWMQHDFPTTQYQYSGGAKAYLQSNHQALMLTLMGIACVYFLLVVLFKNLADPLIIMLTVPFSMIGGALALYLMHGSINVYSALGLLTLVGLITKHGILIVRFANQSLKQGLSPEDAILMATHHRFRPILMTTLAMSLGALPLVFSSNLMYVARESLGITLVGGLILGTLFSLLIVPLVYTMVKQAAPSSPKTQ